VKGLHKNQEDLVDVARPFSVSICNLLSGCFLYSE